jgi:hypothetical protein
MIPKKKLTLRTETLRTLSAPRLRQVVGGGSGAPPSDNCTDACGGGGGGTGGGTGNSLDTLDTMGTCITKTGKAAGCINGSPG